jgi:polyisoprenoid-binding protein YceI
VELFAIEIVCTYRKTKIVFQIIRIISGENKMKKTGLFILSLLLITVTANAQVEWKVDKAHTTVGFKVKHLVISTVTGKFNDFDIKFISNNVGDFSDSRIEAVLKTASINTNEEKRDNHLRSNDFLNAEEFPEITFKSTSFKKSGENTYKVTGDLTIRDVTKPVELKAELGGMTNFMGNTIAAFQVTGEINRFDYNVSWSKKLDKGGLVVSDKIWFDFNVEAGTAVVQN